MNYLSKYAKLCYARIGQGDCGNNPVDDKYIVQMSLRAGEFVSNQVVLKFRVTSPEISCPTCNVVAAILFGR